MARRRRDVEASDAWLRDRLQERRDRTAARYSAGPIGDVLADRAETFRRAETVEVFGWELPSDWPGRDVTRRYSVNREGRVFS